MPIKFGRMMASPFAYYRGSPVVMANDLAQFPSTGINVQAGGDAHLLNFGLFASPERNLIFDVNDFDETHIGPWEWDVKRLAASVVVAGRANGFSDIECRDAAGTTALAYVTRIHEYSGMNNLDVWYSRVDAQAVKDLIARALAARRGRTDSPAARQRASVERSIEPISRPCPSSPSSSTASAASSTCRRS